MKSFISFVIIVCFISPTIAQTNLQFQKTGDGVFAFDTGAVKGTLQADQASQGIPTMIEKRTGIDLAYGGTNPGILSYYRLFTANKRWGDTARDVPKNTFLLKDGSVKIVWPSCDERPFEMTAVYTWKTPTILDLETSVTPDREMKAFEVFLSSYFNSQFKTSVYVKQTLHTPGDPFFLPTEVNPAVDGTFLAFPRDRQAAQSIFDGRWDYPPHPVHFSVGKYFEYPLCIKRDEKNDITVLLMSRAEDCFAVEAPYEKEPPDGISGHNSIYFSLFGQDIGVGQTVRAFTRLQIVQEISESEAVDSYNQFIDDGLKE